MRTCETCRWWDDHRWVEFPPPHEERLCRRISRYESRKALVSILAKGPVSFVFATAADFGCAEHEPAGPDTADADEPHADGYEELVDG